MWYWKYNRLFNQIRTTDTKTYTSNNVEEYFKAIQWNLNLYQGKLNTRFIPAYDKINIKSIIKYFPSSIEPINEDINWLKSEAFTLLLMPVTGKDFLPENLKPFLDKDSPIKDLFPEPCIKCIEWKKKLREIIKPKDDAPEKEFIEYKNLVSTTNVAYAEHIKEYHNNTELPIKRLEDIFI